MYSAETSETLIPLLLPKRSSPATTTRLATRVTQLKSLTHTHSPQVVYLCRKSLRLQPSHKPWIDPKRSLAVLRCAVDILIIMGTMPSTCIVAFFPAIRTYMKTFRAFAFCNTY